MVFLERYGLRKEGKVSNTNEDFSFRVTGKILPLDITVGRREGIFIYIETVYKRWHI
jgi:hypothetical protein